MPIRTLAAAALLVLLASPAILAAGPMPDPAPGEATIAYRGPPASSTIGNECSLGTPAASIGPCFTIPLGTPSVSLAIRDASTLAVNGWVTFFNAQRAQVGVTRELCQWRDAVQVPAGTRFVGVSPMASEWPGFFGECDGSAPPTMGHIALRLTPFAAPPEGRWSWRTYETSAPVRGGVWTNAADFLLDDALGWGALTRDGEMNAGTVRFPTLETDVAITLQVVDAWKHELDRASSGRVFATACQPLSADNTCDVSRAFCGDVRIEFGVGAIPFQAGFPVDVYLNSAELLRVDEAGFFLHVPVDQAEACGYDEGSGSSETAVAGRVYAFQE